MAYRTGAAQVNLVMNDRRYAGPPFLFDGPSDVHGGVGTARSGWSAKAVYRLRMRASGEVRTIVVETNSHASPDHTLINQIPGSSKCVPAHWISMVIRAARYWDWPQE